jgi:hypothetical protein
MIRTTDSLSNNLIFIVTLSDQIIEAIEYVKFI